MKKFFGKLCAVAAVCSVVLTGFGALSETVDGGECNYTTAGGNPTVAIPFV